MRFASIDLETETIWRWGLALVGLAFLFQFIVILSVHFPPQHDTPNHMARHFLEERYLFGGSLPPFYEIHYRVLPNLGADLVVPLLLRLFEPVTACKIFLCLAAMLYWFGPALFIWQHGDYRPSALLASLLLLPLNLSGTFFWGFLNYYSSIGLAFLAVVHFNSLSRQERPSPLGIVLHGVLVTLVFFWHLAAIAIYGVLIGSQVAVQAWLRYRNHVSLKSCILRALVLVAPMLPALVLYGVYSLDKAGLPPLSSHWRGLQYKLLMPFYLFRTYDALLDVVVTGLWAAIALAFFGWKWWTGERNYLWMGTGVFLAMSLAMPFSWGSTHAADLRLLPPLLVCVLAILGTLPVRHLRLGLGLLAVCLVVRYGGIYVAWHRLDTRLVEMARAFEYIPRGSRIMPVNLLPADMDRSKEHPEFYFAAWAVPFREAYVPTLFAFRDQQPLHLKQELPAYIHTEGSEVVVEEEPTRSDYDFVWLYNPANRQVRMPDQFKKVFSENAFSLWGVAR
jgi:hypothetical protein